MRFRIAGHSRSATSLSAVLLVLALVATACGGSASSDSAEDGETATSDVAAAEPASSDETAGDGDDADSGEAPQTLEAYLGNAAVFVRGGGGRGQVGAGFDADAQADEQQLIQQAIQVCMIEQGFEYTPEATGDFRFFLATEDGDLSAQAYAETRGFGISTRFDSILEGDVEFEAAADPNDEYVATLGEAEAEAWQFALRGARPERNEEGQFIDPETGEVIQGGRGAATGGCARDAQDEVRGDLSGLQDLQEEFELLDERIDADPQIVQIRSDWASCMRGGGFAWDTEADARDEFQQEFQPLIRSFFGGGPGQGGGQGGGGAGPLETLAEEGLTNEQEVELAGIQDREIAAAVASLDCWGDGQDQIAEITATYEAEFVESNRAALEALG